MVAAAIIGGAIVGGVSSNVAASKGASASNNAAALSSDATLASTQLQVQEIQRQFDYQQQVLAPRLQQQYNAQHALSSLMGFGPDGGMRGQGITPFRVNDQGRPSAQAASNVATAPPPVRNSNQEILNTLSSRRGEIPDGWGDRFSSPGGNKPSVYQAAGNIPRKAEAQTVSRPTIGNSGMRLDSGDEEPDLANPVSRFAPAAAVASYAARKNPQQTTTASPIAGPTGHNNNAFLANRNTENLGFMDPNLSREQFGYDNYLDSERGQVVANTLQAGTPFTEDLAYQNAQENALSGQFMTEDEYFQHVQNNQLDRDTNIVGESFQESPGYAFAREEMERQLDRKNSAGGNYGGAAVMEAQRRAEGLANQDYYNWVNARGADLDRAGADERFNLARGDQAAADFTGREDANRRLDASRMDAALENYFSRRSGDASRLENAAIGNTENRQLDRQRQDQSYYNYLNTLSGVAGSGNAQSQAVQASQSAGGQLTNAYAGQGNSLSSIYQNQGRAIAGIEQQRYSGINDSIQGGMGNYLYASQAGLI